MWRLAKTIVFAFLHIAAIIAIGYAFLPIAQWYLNHRPILGVDFYNSATFATYFKENLHPFQQNYADFWYSGIPLNSYLVIGWFRIYSLVARILPLLTAVKVTSLTAYFLLVVFVYFGTYRLSRNSFVAVVLSLLVLSSGSMYGSLTWGGSLPYFANQFFFPLILYLLVNYLETGNKRWYYLTILCLGIAVIGHIGNAAAFGIPGAVILILFGKRIKPTSIKHRVKETVVFIVILNILVYRYIGAFWDVLLNLLSTLFGLTILKIPGPTGVVSHSLSTSGMLSDTQDQIAAFYRNIVYKLFTDTNIWLFVVLGVASGLFILGVVISRRKRDALSVVPWILIAVYTMAHVYLNANGISFLFQGWYRAFWQFPIAIAFLSASLIGACQKAIASYGKVVSFVLFVVVAAIWSVVGGLSYVNQDVHKTIEFIEKESSPSSAYPEALNLFRTDAEFTQLRNSLLPKWMNSQNKQYRFFTNDAQVIVWWNALFDIPLARGYFDPPGNNNQHHLLDQAISGDGLVENYKYPQDIARNMALYYIDWYAIKYFEGGHLSQSPNKPPSTYLKDVIAEQTDVETNGVYFLHETKSGKPEVNETAPQYMKYYRFADEVTSPIVSISNAPTLACFCDFPAYESLVKILSMHNLNSRYLVSLYIPEAIDSFSEKELSRFDAIILSNYRYQNRNKTFSLLQKYLESGGKLYFDTGGEVKESESRNLPDWFPFSQSVRGGLGTEWQLEVDNENNITDQLDTRGFSPPLFEKKPWNFSYPKSDVKPLTEALLRHNGKPLLTRSQIGRGVLIWSGMNLPYHIQYYTNVAESQLFINILKSLIPLTSHQYQEVETVFKGSNQITTRSSSAGKGILIKRQAFDNWRATVNGTSENTFKAGPSSPGFIYVPLQTKGSIDAQVGYIGNHSVYFQQIVFIVTGLILFDLSFLNGLFIAKYFRKMFNFYFKRTAAWWEKEEDGEE